MLYMYATRSVAYIDMPYSGYIISCILKHVFAYPKFMGIYNVNMSLHGCLCTIYIHTYIYTGTSINVKRSLLKEVQSKYILHWMHYLEIYQYLNHTKCIRWSVPVPYFHETASNGYPCMYCTGNIEFTCSCTMHCEVLSAYENCPMSCH